VSNLFQTLAGAAGLAGISVGFVLVIFRDIIKKNIFPKLNAEHSYGILRLIIQLTFGIGILGIGAWVIDRSHILSFNDDPVPTKKEAQVSQPDSTPPSEPLDRKSEAEFRKRTYAIVADIMGVPPSSIKPSTRLYNQSFQLDYLVAELETSFVIQISDEESHRFRTAEDVVKCVELHVTSQ
jgi:acyl carrier protein